MFTTIFTNIFGFISKSTFLDMALTAFSIKANDLGNDEIFSLLSDEASFKSLTEKTAFGIPIATNVDIDLQTNEPAQGTDSRLIMIHPALEKLLKDEFGYSQEQVDNFFEEKLQKEKDDFLESIK